MFSDRRREQLCIYNTLFWKCCFETFAIAYLNLADAFEKLDFDDPLLYRNINYQCLDDIAERIAKSVLSKCNQCIFITPYVLTCEVKTSMQAVLSRKSRGRSKEAKTRLRIQTGCYCWILLMTPTLDYPETDRQQ